MNPWRHSPPSLKGPLVLSIELSINQQAKPILVKKFYASKEVKLTKKELLEYSHVVGRKPAYKLAMNESDWKTYYGSNKEIVAMLKEGKHDEFKREILCLATSKKLLTYYETKHLFVYSVLEKPDEFFNDNILGKFFRKDFAE
jgi:hypothetical protein